MTPQQQMMRLHDGRWVPIYFGHCRKANSRIKEIEIGVRVNLCVIL
jgi:hypothetical protein